MAKKTRVVKFRDAFWVDINLVEPNKYNPNAMNPDEYEAFCSFIDEVGFMHPLAVAPKNEQGKYVVIDGEHRLRYLKERGAKKIPVVEMPADYDGQNTDSMLASLRFNIHGTNDALRLGEVYRAATMDGYSPDMLAATIGERVEDVQKMLDMLDYNKSSGEDLPDDEDEDEEDEAEFTEIIFTVPTLAWKNVILPEIKRMIKIAGIKPKKDETVMFGEALELIAAQSAQTPAEEAEESEESEDNEE